MTARVNELRSLTLYIDHAAKAREAEAAGLSRQQRLYFLPLPQGQGSLRLILAGFAAYRARAFSLCNVVHWI
jgi:hypothetical protein